MWSDSHQYDASWGCRCCETTLNENWGYWYFNTKPNETWDVYHFLDSNSNVTLSSNHDVPILSWDFVSYEWAAPYALGILVFVTMVMTCVTVQRVCKQTKGDTKYKTVVYK